MAASFLTHGALSDVPVSALGTSWHHTQVSPRQMTSCLLTLRGERKSTEQVQREETTPAAWWVNQTRWGQGEHFIPLKSGAVDYQETCSLLAPWSSLERFTRSLWSYSLSEKRSQFLIDMFLFKLKSPTLKLTSDSALPSASTACSCALYF